MNKYLKGIALALALFFVTPKTYAQVLEIPRTDLRDIARVIPYRGGVAIIYNPILCQQAGPDLCEFYKAHEYGHVNLGHVPRGTHPVRAEAEADCWAAQHAPDQAVNAAFEWFISGGGAGWHHGSGPQRAKRVRDCYRRQR